MRVIYPTDIRLQAFPKVSVAVFGPEKSGKTHFWCTFPQPIYVAYCDPHMATVQGFILDGADITLCMCDSWRAFESEFMPKVMARELEAQTIVVDSYSILSDRLVDMLKGGQDALTIPQWGRVKSKHFDMVTQLVEVTHPLEGKPSYNVVLTAHETDVTDDKDTLVKVRPAIQGSFKDVLGRCVDTVLFSRVEEAKRTVDPKTHQSRIVVPKHFLYTVPPDRYHSGGDSVGGKGGRAVLPPVIENTYQALMEGWGLKSE